MMVHMSAFVQNRVRRAKNRSNGGAGAKPRFFFGISLSKSQPLSSETPQLAPLLPLRLDLEKGAQNEFLKAIEGSNTHRLGGLLLETCFLMLPYRSFVKEKLCLGLRSLQTHAVEGTCPMLES